VLLLIVENERLERTTLGRVGRRIKKKRNRRTKMRGRKEKRRE